MPTSFPHSGDITATAAHGLVARDAVDNHSLKDREDAISGDVIRCGLGNVNF